MLDKPLQLSCPHLDGEPIVEHAAAEQLQSCAHQRDVRVAGANVPPEVQVDGGQQTVISVTQLAEPQS